jgi:hypothetical protein
MTPSAVLDPAEVRLEPGTSATVSLQLRNTGDIVEGYRVEIVGSPAAWTTVQPPEVTLYPGDGTTVEIEFHPPRSADVPAGEHSYGARVVPSVHPDDAVVPEGVVEVLPFLHVTAELIPRMSAGRRGGRHQVAVDNRGNAPVAVAFEATDPADALLTRVRPETAAVEPGRAAFAHIRVRPARTMWRGTPTPHPFTVVATPEDGSPIELDGTHAQLPLIPAWLPRALALGLAALVALALLWFGLLKRTIDSTAQSAVMGQVAQVSAQAKRASAAAESAKGSAAAAGTSAKQVQKRTGAGSARPVVELPFARRLDVTTALRASGTQSYTIPTGDTVALTDFIFENPQGDFGTLRLTLGATPLFNFALENFRTSDFHFVTPISAGQGQRLTLTVRCNAVGKPPGQTPAPTTCSTGAYLGGKVTRVTRPPAAG